MIRKLIALIGFLLSAAGISQNYKPIDTADYLQRKEFLKNFAVHNESLIKGLKLQYSGRTGSEMSKIYKEFGTDFENQVKNKDFVFKSDFDAVIKSLVERLRKNNPKIPQDLKILIARDNTPNAYCLADGTFVINMGLYNWMDNEAQVAGVISHELGHKIEDHTLKSVLNTVEQNELDKSTVQNIKKQQISAVWDAMKKHLMFLKTEFIKRNGEEET